MKPIRLFIVLVTGLFLLLSALVQISCKRQESAPVPKDSGKSTQGVSSSAGTRPFRIGMGAMITPKTGLTYYNQLKDYIEIRFGQPIQLVDRGNYSEVNKLLKNGEIDAAFVCSGPYVDGKEHFGLELLAMPLVKGKPAYHSYLIVHRDSPVHTLEDLRGKSFAFTDPKSNTGKLVPTYMLAKIGETPQHFFGKTEYTYGHDNSIRAVAEHLVDGAAIDSLVWEYMAIQNPELTAKTRILIRSEPYGIPPFVVRPGLPAEQKQKLLQILLDASNDSKGRLIMKGMMVDKFVPGNDSNYDSIRSMNRWLAEQGKQQ